MKKQKVIGAFLIVVSLGLLLGILSTITYLQLSPYSYKNRSLQPTLFIFPTSTPIPSPTPTTIPTPTPTSPPLPTQAPIVNNNWWDYPNEIKTYNKDEIILSTVVDKGNALPSDYVPSDLVVIPSSINSTNSFYLSSIVISSLEELFIASNDQDFSLGVISAYRSYATQQSTYSYWVSYNGGSTASADRVSARAGHSEHQLGTVVDLSSSEINYAIGSQFHTTKAASWLKDNAWKYGFTLSYPQGKEGTTGYSYESWHYRYVGKDLAKTLHETNQTLGEYSNL